MSGLAWTKVTASPSEEGEPRRPAVLLHGFLGSGRNLRTLANRWAQAQPSRELVLMDLPGHGASPPPPPGASLATMGAAVLATAEEAGLTGPLTLVGHSLGGRVALAAMGELPQRIERVELLDISPGPIVRSDSQRVLEVLLEAPDEAPDLHTLEQSLVGGGLTVPVAQWLLLNVERVEGRYRWRLDRRALEALHQRVNAEDLWPVVEGRPSGVSLRCVRGGRSPYVSEAEAQRLERAGCPVVTLPGAGHYVHVEGLEQLVPLLAQT